MTTHLKLDGHVAILTLEDRARRNALSRKLILSALDGLRDSRVVGARAVVITGYDRTFSAGADIGDLLDAGWMTGQSEGATPYQLFSAIESDPRPVFAAVNGLALGGGFELALCCDLVFAAGQARFSLPEVGVGVIPNTALVKLARVCGSKFAADLVLTRRILGAADAREAGIVSRVYPDADLLAETVAEAARIVATSPPSALAVAKAGLNRSSETPWEEIEASVQQIDTREWREGLGAFLSKRKPDYETFWEKVRR